MLGGYRAGGDDAAFVPQHERSALPGGSETLTAAQRQRGDLCVREFCDQRVRLIDDCGSDVGAAETKSGGSVAQCVAISFDAGRFGGAGLVVGNAVGFVERQGEHDRGR